MRTHDRKRDRCSEAEPEAVVAFFDAHAHCTSPGFSGCLVASDLEGWAELVDQAGENPVALGIHPWVAEGVSWPEIQARLAQLPHQAHGEIGLDKTRPNVESQRDVFLAQLSCATKPLVIHSVRAHAEVLKLLKQTAQQEGMVHDFVGSLEEALAYIRQGLYVSFGPRLLRSPKAQRAAQRVPLERLLIESDAERVADLSRIEEVAARLAVLREIPLRTLIAHTAANARRLFL